MRIWTGICVVLVIAAAVFSACIGAKDLPVPNPANPTLFVDYQRTGGFAGINDRLVIFDNGVALVQRGTTSREILINRSGLEQVSALFDAAQFAMLEGNYTSRRGGADLIQYSITYKDKTVNTEDTAIPPALEPVIKEMDHILSTGLSGGQADLSLPKIGS